MGRPGPLSLTWIWTSSLRPLPPFREEAVKRLEVARHALVDAEESVRLISRRFENSLMTMVELMDAQTTLNRARAQLVENESSYALATARLFHAAGIFLKEVYK